MSLETREIETMPTSDEIADIISTNLAGEAFDLITELAFVQLSGSDPNVDEIVEKLKPIMESGLAKYTEGLRAEYGKECAELLSLMLDLKQMAKILDKAKAKLDRLIAAQGGEAK